MPYNILVVEGDEDVAEAIERTLSQAGYEASIASSGAQALDIVRQSLPDLVVLDVMMPGTINGVDILRHLRANPDWFTVPILAVTGEERPKTIFGEEGLDGYICRPFDLRELELRIRALLRRTRREQEEASPLVEVGDLVLDRRSYELRTPDGKVTLGPTEFELVQFLMRHAGKVCSYDQLLQGVWGYPKGKGLPELVQLHIRNIRWKIEQKRNRPVYIVSVRGRGFMIVSPDQD